MKKAALKTLLHEAQTSLGLWKHAAQTYGAAMTRLIDEKKSAIEEVAASRKEVADARAGAHKLLGELIQMREERDGAHKLLGELIQVIPDTYGEAVQLGVIQHGECANHEWDNRTRAENAVWLIRRRTQQRDVLRFERHALHERVHQICLQRDDMREERDAANAERDKMREERDAARAERDALREPEAAWRDRDEARADANTALRDRDEAYSKLNKLHAKLIDAEARVRQLEEEREQFHDQSLMPEHVSVLLATLNKRSDAARLWKRAAKRYRREAQDMTWAEVEHMREERDDVIAIERALREDYYRLREECDGQRCIVARLTKERDAAMADIARMRPVVQQACIAYDAGGLLDYSGPGVHTLRRAVEAYRASGKENNMTPEQREAQRRSFVYGNTKMANDSVTPAAPERVWCLPWNGRGCMGRSGEWYADSTRESAVEYLRADVANDPLAASQVRAALEAAAERAVEWLRGDMFNSEALRRAVMGDEE